MNLHQFRFVRETVRQNFNLTEAAKVLFTSQPGVSKAIIELEEELGVEIFHRHGKRVRNLTEPGKQILVSLERILQEIETVKSVGKDYAAADQGSLTIATTHTQARYILPKIIIEFAKRFPKVHLSIQQGNPSQIAEMVENDQADLAIASEQLLDNKHLVALPAYQWQHNIIAPPDHPLLKLPAITLQELAKYPLITYDAAFARRKKIDSAFADQQLTPNIVLEAIDADVIKTYVEIGMGIGIIADTAFDAARDTQLRALPAENLFGIHCAYIGLKQHAYLRSYIYTFIELLAPSLKREQIQYAINHPGK